MGVWTPGPGATIGNDTFVGDNTNEVASGGEGNDTLSGNGGSDTLNGGEGDDILAGGLANDIVNGDAGNDTINWAWGDGVDTIDGGADFDTFNATGSAADNVMRATWNGSALTSVLDGSIANVEAINADMGAGVDWLVYTATAGVNVNLQAGTASGFNSVTNIENVIGGSGHDTISGNGAANRLEGGLGDDVLNGAAGADNLIGGDGADTLSGGLAGDSVNGGVGNDTLIWNWGEGADTLNGGADTDTLNATGSGADNIVRATWNGSQITNLFDNVLVGLEVINVDMGGGIDWLVYIATSGVTVDLGAGTASGFASVTSVENVIGGSGGDTITGSALDNRLDGAEGADTLNGAAGIDIVIGGLGADTLAGGLGNDNVIGDAGNDTLTWNWGDGRDTLNGGADVDTLNATGSAAENIVQAAWNGSVMTNLFDNVLVGVEAINLDMGGGTDWLVYNTSANVSVDLGAGTGTGFASLTSIENVIAGSGTDTITGSAVANRLEGGLGNDALNGAGGIDNLIGGEGADTLAGGLANDTITGGAGDDTVAWAWGDGADAINGGADSDTLNITGSAAENILNASYNGVTLTSVVAGTLVSVEAVNADMGGGEDWLVYTTTSGVSVDLGAGTATGFASITAVENVVGAGGNDTLTGDTAANKLLGGAGADTLTANEGADILFGGADADTVHGGGGQDEVYGEGGDDTLLVGGTLDSESGETYDGGDGFDTLRAQGAPGNTAEFRLSTLAGIEAVALQNMTAYFAAEALGVGLASALVVDGLNVDNGIYFQRTTAGATDLSTLTFQNWTAGSLVTLEGSTGDDTLTGSSQVNSIIGGDGSDILVGGALADTLSGGDAVDYLTGGAGLDVVNGGDGSDHIYITAASDLIAGETYDGGAHNDDHIWLQAAGSYSFVGVNVANVELLVLNASGIDVTLSAESLGAGFASALRVDSTFQSPVINVVRSTAGTTSLASWVFFNPGGTEINLTGSSGDDVLTGSSRQDTISGGDGADTLNAGAGNDTLIGGDGNDTYVLTTSATITESAGEGTDTVLTAINLTLSSEVENATVTGVAGLTITGNASNNVITGGDGSDVLDGAGGADTLSGGGDTDYLTGGAGLDSVSGGDGSDHIYISAPTDLVAGETYDGGAHNDDHIWLQSAGSYSFNGLTISGVELLVMNAAGITLTFDADLLGAGLASALRVDATNQSPVINVVRSSAGTTDLSGWVFFNPGGVQVNLIGSAGADLLTGTSRGDTLIGDYGVDELYGGDGNDALRMNDDTALIAGEVYDGGIGTDTLVASLDINDVRNATVTSIERAQFVGVAPTQVIYLNADQIGAGFSTTLEVDGGNVGTAVMYTYRSSGGTTDVSGWTFLNWSASSYVGFSGSSGADILIGSSVNDLMVAEAGADTLSGGAGNDSLDGSGGDDTIEGSAGDDLLDGGADTDTLSYANASAGITISFALFGSAQNTGGAGTDTISNFENLTGSSFNDTLFGNGNANTIDGGAGTDTMSYAGVGNFVTVSLALQGGAQDTFAGGSDTLTGFENLTGTSHSDTLGGDANNNVIVAGSGTDTVDGGGGNDTLSGDAGNDTITGGLGDDTIDGGADTDTASYAAAASGVTVNLATLTAQNTVGAGTDTLSNVENVTGSAFADVLTGDGNANVLSGGAGNDTLDGGAGNDTLDGGANSDAASYANAASGVTVNLSTVGAQNTVGAGTDTLSNFENLTGSGFNDTLTGDGSANVLSGGAGNDTLAGGGGDDNFSGSAGTDTIDGGAGEDVINAGADNDTLTGGANTDVFVYGAGAGADTITDFDADATGGQDFIDITQFGITSGDFASRVTITDLGANTLVTIDGSVTITLTGVDGNGANVITIADFGLV